MRYCILSVLLAGGLFFTGLAQVADNVDEATRFRVTVDNITTVTRQNTNTSIAEVNPSDVRILDNRSNFQLEELGSRYGWVRSNTQLNELGSRYGWVRSNTQLNELGSRYGWVRSNTQLNELGSR
ncbi:MAG: hypothetical protein V3V72_10860, partial [Ignavibacteriaceae bacterium]